MFIVLKELLVSSLCFMSLQCYEKYCYVTSCHVSYGDDVEEEEEDGDD